MPRAAVILVAAGALAGCGQREPRAYTSAEHVRALFVKIDSMTEPEARLPLLQEVLALTGPFVARSRLARHQHLATEAWMAQVCAAAGRPDEAGAWRDRRARHLREHLEHDPGDGRLRGQLAYEAALGGRFEEAWTLLEEGVPLTDPSTEEEAPLLEFAVSVEALEDPLPPKPAPALPRLVSLIERFRERASARHADAWCATLNADLARRHLRLGDLDAAERCIVRLEELDPASAVSVELRRVLRDAR